jgi:hypothetical protein
MLFHISEEPDINIFEPRPSAYTQDPVVWGIDREHLRNYLFPRECPRVTYAASEKTTAEDLEQFLGASVAVAAIETAWLDRVRSARLFCYHLSRATFECLDRSAGYFVSRSPVVPTHCEAIADPLAELRKRGVALRVFESVWALHDAVAASTLEFSMIRMHNAQSREPTREP